MLLVKYDPVTCSGRYEIVPNAIHSWPDAMNVIRLTLFSLLILLSLNLLSRCGGPQETTHIDAEAPRLAPTVLLISLDGFRADYLDRYDAPTLQALAANGLRSEGLIPSFPTKTLPNHYSIVTGLYPDHHGIVGNTIYDPVFDATFRMSDREEISDGRWWGGEPIWATAELQGQRSAPLFWPGSEAEIAGVRPTYWMPYQHDMPGPKRINQVLDWLDLPAAQRPTFLTLYFHHIDSAGHDHGPDSDAVAEAILEVDGYLQQLVEGLQTRGILDAINIVIVADHGMAARSTDRVIFLDDYISLEDVIVVDWTPVLLLRPKEGREDAVYNALQAAPYLSVYRKEDLPGHLHLGTNRRVPPIVGVADEGWSISSHGYFARNPSSFEGGTHGYDNRSKAMHALFIAHGPAFPRGRTVEPFQNIHLYNMLAHILRLKPAPNDGDSAFARSLLVPEAVTR